MNIMRKLWITNANTQQQQNMNSTPSSQSISLAVMHLRKLYGEYTHTTQDPLLYNMLPIFCKLFNNLSYPELTDRFPETSHFTSSISRLLVLELRKRAGNPSTTEASNAIITYLYPTSQESDGFMLLSTINLLSSTDESIIEIMCGSNLPSTLVKCLYLFFDLGPCVNEDEVETRELVQKVFVQVLIRVCSYSVVSEELCKKDDLALLFSCVSSWCGEGNKSWRKCAGDVLMSVSTHGLGSEIVLGYIHNKACIPLCVDNLRRGGGSSSTSSINTQPHFLTPVEITESVFTLFCFLKDSSSSSQLLLDDFKSAQGYTFLTELATTLEKQSNSEQELDSLKNLTTLITSLTTYGPTILKPNPQNTSTPFTLPNFSLPSPPSPKSSSIRNTQAFNILITLFNNHHTNQTLPNLILDSISSVFRADKQNYFIVDSFLPQMAEKLPQKSVETQIKYLNVIEFLVFELNFTPCKELIALSRVIKNSTDKSTNMIMFKLLIVKSLLKILRYSGVFKEAYREIGILEVAFSCICIEDNEDNSTAQTTHLNQDLTSNLLELISQLISSNAQNLQIFREQNTSINLLKLIKTSQTALNTLSIALTSQGGEEEFTHALVWMQGQSKDLVIEMLNVFLNCFRESHRARCNFRKAGGFLYLMSLVVGMEGCFGGVGSVCDMKVFQSVFACFGLAMRFEPANAKLFQQEICLPSLADTIRLLSHFNNNTTLTTPYNLSLLEDLKTSPETIINEFHKIFSTNDLATITTSEPPPHIALTLFTYRVLYDLALDNFDKTNTTTQQPQHSSPSPSQRRLNLSQPNNPDPVIVHSGVVIIMIRLLPSIKEVESDDNGVIDACLCQLYCAELVKSLVRSERNQQIMAGVGVCSEIIEKLGEGLCDERAVVHSALQYVFERVGTQALGAGELRKFLRLGNPLNCNNTTHDSLDSQIAAASTPVPLSRVKTLVSMTTPRSNTTGNERTMLSAHHHHASGGSPSFVEFDMGAEGFGCLFVPSLGCSGVNYGADFVVQGASLLGGGIGSSSSSTFGYSTWFSIDKFSDPKQDPHPVRLLSLIKESSNGVQRLCLSVLISSRDKALIVSTKESGLPPPGIGEWEPDIPQSPNQSTLTQRIFSPDLLNESSWTHLILNFHSNNLTVFINGRQAHSAKMDAPQRQKHSTTHTYSAFIGTPPMWRKASRLCWKQGVAHLFEDFVVSCNIGYYVWKLGAGYLGSFQSVRIPSEKHPEKLVSNATPTDPTTLIPEDKLILGLNSIAVSQLTLQKIRKLYSKSDAKAIARQLGLSSHENATPIQILHNSSAHLIGPTPRPIGGICIGYLGVRVFNPNPVYKSVFSIGGIRVLISLIALANTSESLYASLKALVCVVKGSGVSVDKGQAQVIGFVLKSKKNLLSMRVLHLVFSLVDRDVGFCELLGDVDIWVDDKETNDRDGNGDKIGDLEKALYEHFCYLLNEDKHAYEYFSRAGVLGNLLNRTNSHVHNSLFQVISLLIKHELVTFGYFVIDTLDFDKGPEKVVDRKIMIRNKCLQLLHTCMYTGRNLNVSFCEDVIGNLGFDFVILFVGPLVHVESCVWGMRILMMLLNSSHGNRVRFRDLSGGGSGVFKGLLLMQSRSVLSEYACLGLKRDGGGRGSDGDGSGGKNGGSKSGSLCGGWVRLSYAICQRILSEEFVDVGVEVWLVICALVLGQGVRSTVGFGHGDKQQQPPQLTLDLIWSYVFPSPSQPNQPNPQQNTTSLYGKVTLCPDAIITLLTLTRCHIHANRSADIPNTITQFLCYLYSNTPEFQCVFTSVDILSGLALSLVPVESCVFDKDVDSVFVDDDGDRGDKGIVTTQVPLLGDSPAKKILLDFLRIIIIDWMNTQGSNQKPNQNVVVDTVLDAVGGVGVVDESYGRVVTDFNTRLLGTLLDHLISCDIDRVMGYLNAVAGFLSRVVDKIWVESFERDAVVVMDFVVGVVGGLRTRRSVPPATIDSIYNSLNRVILYILSRKHTKQNETNPWQIVEVLKKLRTIRTTVFSPHNHAQEFFACLTYVLIQLEQNSPINLDVNNSTKWHVPGDSGLDRAVANEISVNACKVWEDVFVSKKPVLEELFKVSFSSPDPPHLSVVKDMVVDAGGKYWVSYLAGELSSKKGSVSCNQSWEIHTQLQSKIQKVTGGLRSFARSSIRKELSIDNIEGGGGSSSSGGNVKVFRKNLVDCWGDAKRFESVGWRVVMGIKENRRGMERVKDSDRVHLSRFVCDSLLPRLEKEVTRERGVWGWEGVNELDKWMLDSTEGPCRMRKKLIRNDQFYTHYPHVPTGPSRPPSTSSLTSSPCKSPNPIKSPYHHHQKNNAPVSFDSFEWYRRCPNISLFECYDYEESVEEVVATRSPLHSSSSVQSGGNDEEDKNVIDNLSSVGEETHSTVLFRLIETECEKISQIFRVAMIQGLDSTEGLLLFGRDHFYLVSGFTILTKTREIKDMYYLPSSSYDPILPAQCYGNVVKKRDHDCVKICFDDVREVLKRRYLLQGIALEVFCSDGRNFLVAFPRKIRNVVFGKFVNCCKLGDSGVGDGKVSVAGQRRVGSSSFDGGLFSGLIGETSVSQRWVRGEISNFQYLMHLNTLAGRSYNDLMQYPVFPWILANYDSPYLDLSDPKTFRDLSKPMGAQTHGRLVQFVKRYKEWDDPQGETPPYHYGTHYSSAMIVCSYLVRMEPFAQHFLRLQGGHFDLADRMFHSIKEAWTSASRHNMADVKELIPEFFYLPDFLKNSNKFDLGLKQNGTPLDDVVLPPWAKGDAREFIRVHRMALESDYVSSRLHEWIDLIFGWRQGGVGAVESVNVFHHLFYEGNVDIYSIEDPLKKNATIGFINNFGQIPKQLFKRAHPCKKVFLSGGGGGGRGYSGLLDGSGVLLSALGGGGSGGGGGQNVMNTVGVLVSGSVVGSFVNSTGGGGSGGGERLFYHGIDCLRPGGCVLKELKGPVGQILPLDNNKPNSILAVEQNKALMSSRFYVSWGFADCSLRVCHVDSDRATVIAELTQNVDWNGEIVACAVANEKIVVTGQTNSVISVWELTSTTSSSSSTTSNPSQSNQSTTTNLPFNQYSSHPSLQLKQNLHGHSDSITCIATSPAYNIILSGSKDRTCIVWDLARLTFTRQLRGHEGGVDCVAINECSGDLASADGGWLRVWDINGGVVGVVDTMKGCGGLSNVLCVSFSCLNDWDDMNVVVSGGSDGVVRFWSVGFSQVRVKGDGEVVSFSSDSDEDGEDGEDKDEVNREIDPDKDTDSLEERCHDVVVKMRSSIAKSGNRSSGSFLTPSGSNTTAAMMREARRESLRGSRSEGNLGGIGVCGGDEGSGSFEVLSEREIEEAFGLGEGCEWVRGLVYRGKLTMHTSYGRKDNVEPASITAVGVARDHKNIYIGDARGRVYGWSVGDVVGGGRADHWVRDEVAEVCTGCSVKFTIVNRIHHCRSCGGVFCARCTRFESEIFRLKILKPVRVCQPCFTTLKGTRSATATASSSSPATSSNPNNNNNSSHGSNNNLVYQQEQHHH